MSEKKKSPCIGRPSSLSFGLIHARFESVQVAFKNRFAGCELVVGDLERDGEALVEHDEEEDARGDGHGVEQRGKLLPHGAQFSLLTITIIKHLKKCFLVIRTPLRIMMNDV